MDNHELRYNGTIATRHLGQLVAPGQSVLVSAHHAVSMHGERGWECVDLKKAEHEINQKAKAVSTQSKENIGEAENTQVVVVPIESALNVPVQPEQPLENAAATDAVVNADTTFPAAETDAMADESVDTKKFPCTKCELKFPSKRKLQIHMNSAHTTNASTSLV